MCQSIPSLTIPSPHPPGRLPGIRTFSLPGRSGFWIREIFYSFERKMQELLYLFQRNRRQLEKQSIPSLTIPSPPGRLPGIRTFSLPGRSGFWIREIFYSFERKMQELLYLFQRNRRQLEKQVFLCHCFISVFAKTVEYLQYK